MILASAPLWTLPFSALAALIYALPALVPRLLSDAREALQMLDEDFAGVVVSDVRLPGLDGIAFFDRLQQLDPELLFVARYSRL